MAYFRKRKGESEEDFRKRIAFVTEGDTKHEDVPHIHVKDAEVIPAEYDPVPPSRVDNADKAEYVTTPTYRKSSIQKLKNGTIITNA